MSKSKKFVWVGTWSAPAEDVKTLVGDLTRRGVHCKADHSVYVGHLMLKVDADHVAKAKKLLPELDPFNGQFVANHCFNG